MNNLGLTRREKIVLIIAAFLAIIFIFIPQQTLNNVEHLYLLCFVIPVTIYILTDPERVQRKP